MIMDNIYIDVIKNNINIILLIYISICYLLYNILIKVPIYISNILGIIESISNTVKIFSRIEKINNNFKKKIIIGDKHSLKFYYKFLNKYFAKKNICIFDIEDGDGFIFYYKTKILIKEDIDIIIHSYGGSEISSKNIHSMLINHRGKINVYILEYAYSAGTYLALLGTKLYLGKTCRLGPTDPQFYIDGKVFSTRTILNLKDKNYNLDTYNLFEEAKKSHYVNIQDMKRSLIKNNYNKKKALNIAKELGSGSVPHSTEFDKWYLNKIGLKFYNFIPCNIETLFINIFN